MVRLRRSRGLLGRILAILLLTVVIEFGASTFLYERASRFLVREDEARRLAEHLVIARRLVSEQPWRQRAVMAGEVSTDRYDIGWAAAPPPTPPLAAGLDDMRRQIVAWEPSLGQNDLRLRLTAPGRRSTVTGSLRLRDGSWLRFRTRDLPPRWDLAVGRIVLALAPAVALFVLGGLLIRHMLRPLRQLAEATDRIGLSGDATVEETGTGEVRRLIRAFNVMQRRIHALIDDRTRALAAVGHDIRTPLARVQLRLDAISDDETRNAIGGDIDEMEAMVASLLAFLNGEDDPEDPRRTDVAVLVATIVDEAQDRGDPATYEGPDHLDALLRPRALKRAVSNLVDNAIHYGGIARVSVVEDRDDICIRVADDGPGIPEDRMDDVLRPFVRLDPARARNTRGLGLGLAIVCTMAERTGGALHLINAPSGGLIAELRLPRRSNDFLQISATPERRAI